MTQSRLAWWTNLRWSKPPDVFKGSSHILWQYDTTFYKPLFYLRCILRIHNTPDLHIKRTHREDKCRGPSTVISVVPLYSFGPLVDDWQCTWKNNCIKEAPRSEVKDVQPLWRTWQDEWAEEQQHGGSHAKIGGYQYMSYKLPAILPVGPSPALSCNVSSLSAAHSAQSGIPFTKSAQQASRPHLSIEDSLWFSILYHFWYDRLSKCSTHQPL